MSTSCKQLRILVVAALALVLLPAMALAQGKSKHYAVTTDKALTVTRNVLVKQGYDVVRVERDGDAQVVYYRRGNAGRGKGKGRLEKMVIRRDAERVVFVDAPPAVLVDIDLQLHL